VVQRDALQLLGIREWRSKAANRNEWRRLIKEAMARKGLYHHIWMDGSI
jgi:RNase P protein component